MMHNFLHLVTFFLPTCVIQSLLDQVALNIMLTLQFSKLTFSTICLAFLHHLLLMCLFGFSFC